jgi:hypothetical protein
MKLLNILTAAACAAAFLPNLKAELTGKDRREAKRMVEGKLYLRIDLPCRYGSPGFFGSGLNVEPLVEVSPTGYKVLEGADPALSSGFVRGTQGVAWWFSPNDIAGYASLQWSGESVIVWMEGIGNRAKSQEVMVRFVQIKTLADFKAAFDQTFSKVPLQDEHPEWPAEIRSAIAEHRVVEGMTKRQVFYALGTPASMYVTTENGVETEIWKPRQERGFVVTFRGAQHSATGYPASLKFTGGKLTVIERSSAEPKLD